MISNSWKAGIAFALSLAAVLSLKSQDSASPSVPVKSSYQFPVAEESFLAMFKGTSAEQPDVRNRQMNVLNERYDLSNRPSPNTKMSRGKPVQAGVRVKLRAGVSGEQLSAMSPEDIRAKGLFPASNHRLVSLTDGQVTFRWRDSAHHNEQKLRSLTVEEFLRRFRLLPHRASMMTKRFAGIRGDNV